GLYLVSHEPGFSVEGVFNGNSDLKSFNRLLKKYDKRILVKETDDGKAMDKQIQVLKNLLKYYNKR
ncbi:MAG: fructose-bisphosphatase class III, partial [Candidatus Borkfalkiaceae bacterium]|nr:fructose-bisphosphatase class III [Christensenellaceae bacterium]